MELPGEYKDNPMYVYDSDEKKEEICGKKRKRLPETVTRKMQKTEDPDYDSDIDLDSVLTIKELKKHEIKISTKKQRSDPSDSPKGIRGRLKKSEEKILNCAAILLDRTFPEMKDSKIRKEIVTILNKCTVEILSVKKKSFYGFVTKGKKWIAISTIAYCECDNYICLFRLATDPYAKKYIRLNGLYEKLSGAGSFLIKRMYKLAKRKKKPCLAHSDFYALGFYKIQGWFPSREKKEKEMFDKDWRGEDQQINDTNFNKFVKLGMVYPEFCKKDGKERDCPIIKWNKF